MSCRLSCGLIARKSIKCIPTVFFFLLRQMAFFNPSHVCIQWFILKACDDHIEWRRNALDYSQEFV